MRVLETKVAKFAIRYSLSFIFLQLDWLLLKMVRFVNKSHQLEPNQITGTTSDFKMGVISQENSRHFFNQSRLKVKPISF